MTLPQHILANENQPSLKEHTLTRMSRQKGRKSRTRRRRTSPGMSPGTLIVDPNAPHPIIHILAYGPEAVTEQEVTDPRDICDFLDKWPVAWVNVKGLGNVDTIRTLGDLFALHRLALEDVIDVHQRSKVEQYEHYLFIIAQMAVSGTSLETEQFSLFLGPRFVLTFEERPGACLDPVRDRIRQKRGRIREAGADYLAYALLDAVIDCYFPLLEEYGERLENLEDDVIDHPSHDTVGRIHSIKRDLLTLRRALWPLRETLNSLLRDPISFMTEETRLHVRDCYDHTVQLIDLVETYRELGSDLMDVYLSSLSNRTNEVMRVLTVIATIFIPLTFIAGVYGMNFNPEKSPWNMPELNWYWGYPYSLVLMAAVACAQLIFFWRRGWLGVPRILNRAKGTLHGHTRAGRHSG